MAIFTIAIAGLPLLLSIYGGYLSANGFLNRIVIDDEHIEIRKGLQQTKKQMWADFDTAVAGHPGRIVIRFKESGRYEVIWDIKHEELGEANVRALVDWLESRYGERVYKN